MIGLGLAGRLSWPLWARRLAARPLLTLTFFGNDLSMGPAWASCADIGERYAGTVSGAMNMVSALAGAGGTALAGYLFRQGRPELVFVIFSGVYVLAALCWLGVTHPAVVRRGVINWPEPISAIAPPAAAMTIRRRLGVDPGS